MSNSLSGPFVKLARALRERGWKGTLTQLYTIGDLKFGQLKGTDQYGNKYYEDLDLPYGQHRWVEYANIHDPDSAMIQPEWHGWMHHTFDETPDQIVKTDKIESVQLNHAIYDNHHGKQNEYDRREMTNLSQYRQRGYKVGSRMTGTEDPDLFYKQPGHPLSPQAEEGGRLKEAKGLEEWIPIRK